jgi:hypothetical protein
MFLQPEYVKALKLLDVYEGMGDGRICKGESTATAFRLSASHYVGDEKYYTTFFVKPYKKGVYLFSLLSGEHVYNNVRVVPTVAAEYVKEENEKGKLEFMILQKPKDIEVVEANTNNETNRFSFWGVRIIPFDGLTARIFNEQLNSFEWQADKVAEGFGDLYYPG